MAGMKTTVTLGLVLSIVFSGAAAQNFTDVINGRLESLLGLPIIPENITALPTLTLPLTIPGLSDLDITLEDEIINGVKEMTAQNCLHDEVTGDVTMSLHEDNLKIYVSKLTMKGTILENIEVDGTGDGWFELEDFTMTIDGPTTEFQFPDADNDLAVQFSNVSLDLKLGRWTVDMQGITPGSDLEEMMNSYFSMNGPDIFKALGIRLSYTDTLINLVNSILPSSVTPTPDAGTTTTAGEGTTTTADAGTTTTAGATTTTTAEAETTTTAEAETTTTAEPATTS